VLICRPTAVVLAVGLRVCERNLDPWRLATAGPVVDRLSHPARRQGGLDARLRLVVRHRHVYVDTVALRARRVHPLEPDGRALAQRVDQPVPGSGPAGLVGVAQHGLSERPDGGGVKRVAPDLEYLHRPVVLTDPDGRVQPELGGHGGDAVG